MPESAKGFVTMMERPRGADFSSTQCDLFERLVADGSPSKTSPASSRPTAVEILERSLLTSLGAASTYQTMGGRTPALRPAREGPSVGALWMRNMPVWRSGASVCSLSQILERGPLPRRYFLSSKACRGILRRAWRRGRDLPSGLLAALAARAFGSRLPRLFDRAGLLGRHRLPPLFQRGNSAGGGANANGSGIGLPGDPSLTLDCDGSAAIAFHARQDPDTSGDVTHPLDTDGQSIGIAFDTTQITSGENRCNPQAGGPCHPLSSTAHPPAYATVYEVRRLTPRECEKLMGVPEDYTLIPYGQKVNPKKISDDWMAYLLRGNPKGLTREDVAALAADGPRYKALGNGFAVPEIRWIGERIEAADKARGKS